MATAFFPNNDTRVMVMHSRCISVLLLTLFLNISSIPREIAFGRKLIFSVSDTPSACPFGLVKLEFNTSPEVPDSGRNRLLSLHNCETARSSW